MLSGPGVCVMKLWMRERDQLIEQTMAFVQGVAAAKPARAAAAAPARTEPAKPVAQAGPAELPREPSRPAGIAPIIAPMGLAPMASERTEIELRVAKFKAQQQKFQRAREAHYDAIFSKARATPGNQTRL
jgi:chorismate mutase